MKKKIRLAQNKDDLHDLGSNDLLSRLSDDILVSILSYLPLKDAAVTSKVSRRWRYLWCQRVCLNFEDNERLSKIRRERDLCKWNKYTRFCYAERNKYINWVNHIIRQHKSPIIDEFKICFDLDKNAKGAIRKWIEFAISKNVQTLELDLGDTSYNKFVFPNKIFDRKCGFSSKRLNVLVTPYATSKEIKFLKSLVLKCVDVDDEGLEKILSNCPVLEHLSIHDSWKLVRAKIDGKGLALKYLEFGGSCSRLQSVEICDSNIVPLNCWACSCIFPISLRLNNLQNLEKICIRKCFSWKIMNHMFCGLPYLQVLELSLLSTQRAMELLPFPELPKLKQLIVNVEVQWDVSLLVFISLVEACSNLHSFKIQLTSFPMRPRGEDREERQTAMQPHQRLEVVEICGYFGLTSHLDLAMYFIENCIALKKLVIEPIIIRRPSENGTWVEENGPRYHARQHLEPRTPVGLELVIL